METPTPSSPKTLTRRDIAQHLIEQKLLEKGEAEKAVNSVLDLLSGHLIGGGRIELRGFGVLEVRKCRGCLGRNPKQPDVHYQIPERKLVRFKMGKELRERLNGPWPWHSEGAE